MGIVGSQMQLYRILDKNRLGENDRLNIVISVYCLIILISPLLVLERDCESVICRLARGPE